MCLCVESVCYGVVVVTKENDCEKLWSGEGEFDVRRGKLMHVRCKRMGTCERRWDGYSGSGRGRREDATRRGGRESCNVAIKGRCGVEERRMHARLQCNNKNAIVEMQECTRKIIYIERLRVKPNSSQDYR